MRFGDYLNETDWYDGELLIDGMESEFSFVWDNDYKFTEAGEEKFAPILNGNVDSCDDDLIEVTSDGADEELINLFHSLVAGYVGTSFYDSMLEKR